MFALLHKKKQQQIAYFVVGRVNGMAPIYKNGVMMQIWSKILVLITILERLSEIDWFLCPGMPREYEKKTTRRVYWSLLLISFLRLQCH